MFPGHYLVFPIIICNGWIISNEIDGFFRAIPQAVPLLFNCQVVLQFSVDLQWATLDSILFLTFWLLCQMVDTFSWLFWHIANNFLKWKVITPLSLVLNFENNCLKE